MRVLLVFESGTDVSARAIQCIEERLGDGIAAPHPLASHVWICCILDDGTMVGIEAVPPAVRQFSPGEKAGRALRAYEVPCTPAQAATIHATALAAVGRPYAFDAVLGTLLSLVDGKPETFWGDPSKRVDCVEACATWLRSASIAFCGTTPAFDLTPSGSETFSVAHFPRAINWLSVPAPTRPEAA